MAQAQLDVRSWAFKHGVLVRASGPCRNHGVLVTFHLLRVFLWALVLGPSRILVGSDLWALVWYLVYVGV